MNKEFEIERKNHKLFGFNYITRLFFTSFWLYNVHHRQFSKILLKLKLDLLETNCKKNEQIEFRCEPEHEHVPDFIDWNITNRTYILLISSKIILHDVLCFNFCC